MAFRAKLTGRRLLIVWHDLFVTAAALLITLYIRFEERGLAERWPWLRIVLPCFVIYSGFVYHFCHLHEAKWRFASLPDLSNIVRAATVLAISLLVLDYILISAGLYGRFFFGKVAIALYWALQVFLLGGSRLAYRSFRHTRTRRQSAASGATRTLVLGRAADAEVLLRSVESGAIKNIEVSGILSPSPADQGTVIRGVPIVGALSDLDKTLSNFRERGISIGRLILMSTAMNPEVKPEAILLRARQLGIPVSGVPFLEDAVGPTLGVGKPILSPIAVEDLLLRAAVKIDYEKLEGLIKGASVVVTGGGGSIGAEICRRVMAFGASRLLIIENSEPALHAILEGLSAKGLHAYVEGRLADIRDRERIFSLIRSFRPELVFHAAALKHVPLLERDWSEGIKTNVFGSINVADAAVDAGARAMVMISTDKAIEPVSILGSTKSFAEMYCQALDADLAEARARGEARTRLISVRFGNVLASNGSVVPKFKAQIEAGGPITVTHPDMVRYFMTIREACDLVITSATHALEDHDPHVSVYVLNMGQPVKIVDLAHRMIQLSGLEPGRDIEIVFSGIRPGERLNEILFSNDEPTMEIGIDGVVAAKPTPVERARIDSWRMVLERALRDQDRSAIFNVLNEAVPTFRTCAGRRDTMSNSVSVAREVS
jgi:FlaA1/EpsC-like NDP-sugar epimerase